MGENSIHRICMPSPMTSMAMYSIDRVVALYDGLI